MECTSLHFLLYPEQLEMGNVSSFPKEPFQGKPWRFRFLARFYLETRYNLLQLWLNDKCLWLGVSWTGILTSSATHWPCNLGKPLVCWVLMSSAKRALVLLSNACGDPWKLWNIVIFQVQKAILTMIPTVSLFLPMVQWLLTLPGRNSLYRKKNDNKHLHGIS